MSASMAEVLRTHQWAETFDRCVCGEFLPFIDQAIAAHQAAVLAANGYGKLEDAWDEGYTTGNAHNGRRNANPYRSQA